MSDIYNPESALQERIEALAIEARTLKHLHDQAGNPADRRTIARQLREVEREIELLKRRLPR